MCMARTSFSLSLSFSFLGERKKKKGKRVSSSPVVYVFFFFREIREIHPIEFFNCSKEERQDKRLEKIMRLNSFKWFR